MRPTHPDQTQISLANLAKSGHPSGLPWLYASPIEQVSPLGSTNFSFKVGIMLCPNQLRGSLLVLGLLAGSLASAQTAQTLPASAYNLATKQAIPSGKTQNVRLLSDAQRGGIPQFIEYQNGQLQITAEDSTLGKVLDTVCQLLGAQIVAPPELSTERIAVHLGPAPPGEVVHSLLDGSRFDYIIMGSTEKPEAVKTLIIKLHNSPSTPGQFGSSSVPAAATAAMPAANQQIAKDYYGEYRLPNGLTTQESALTREELLKKFEEAHENQRLQQQQIQQQAGEAAQ